MIKVGVFGASGYMGGEVIRVLLEHPKVEIVWATSRSSKPLEYFHRSLFGSNVKLVKPDEITPCDVVFMALPTGNAMEIAPDFNNQGTKIIDLGADFRLNDRNIWECIYNRPHTCWELMKKSVYGIPELHREEIKKAEIVANPGCFSSAAILGLAPLIKNNIIDTSFITITGLSGTAGAGSELDISIHHPEIGNNIVPYNVVDHRHTYEIEQELELLTDEKVCVNFTPAYVPITRGILDICNCFPIQKITRVDIIDLYKDFYKDEPFIKIFDMPKEPNLSWQYMPYPWVAATSGTNYCHIGMDVDEKRNRVVIFSVLDSIGKGGAHVGIQNMNILFGLDEKTGLKRYGLHPY